MSKLLSCENKPILPFVVVAVNCLIDKIEKICFELDSQKNPTPQDDCLITALQAERDKIIKHYQKSNRVYRASLILDPRFKLDGFRTAAWGRELRNGAEKNSVYYFIIVTVR